MRRPLVSIAAGLVLGILAGESLYTSAVSPVMPLAVAAVSAGLGVVLLVARVRPCWCFVAAIGAVAAGGAAYMMSRYPKYSSPAFVSMLSREPRIFRVRGFIENVPDEEVLPPADEGDSKRFKTRFTLRVARCLDRGAWRALPGRLRVVAAGRLFGVTCGDGVEVALSAHRVFPPRNPGEFDGAGYFARRGIAGTAWIADAAGVRPTGETRVLPGLPQVFRLERHIKDIVDERLPERVGAILKCLILGERRALKADQQRAFRETGTAHFFSVSGLHVGLVAGVLWYVLLVWGVRHRTAAVSVIVVVLFYAIMAGFRPGVLRATVMCCVVCGAFFFNRVPNLPSSLALALVIVLLWEPAELFSAGLHLSFAAVWGIWAFTLPLERALFRVPDELDRLQAAEERRWFDHPFRWILQKTLCVSLAAWVTTLPLALYHFNSMSVFAPLNTMLLMPAVFLVLVAGLPGLLVAAVSGMLAGPLLGVAIFGAELMDWLGGMLAKLPGTVFYLPAPGWPWVLLCYAVFAAVVFRQKLRLNARRIAILGLIPPLLYLGFIWPPAVPRHLTITVLSMGEGNCVLVRFPDGKNLLYDAGSWGSPRCGERMIVPALWSAGVRRLDLVVLSHSDTDHYIGFLGLARRIPVGRLAVSRQFDRHAETTAMVEEAASHGIEVVRIGAGDRIAGFPEAHIEVLWPPADMPLANELTDNELCCVVRVQSEGSTVLLTGDFGRRGAAMLLPRTLGLRADILQIPHHGRRDSAARALAAAVKPRVAVIPGGRYAEKPSPYARHAERVLTTDTCGMVTVELPRGEAPVVSTFLTHR